jgi:putative transcriptional regulator
MKKKRDINAELAQSLDDLKAGRGRKFTVDVPGDVKQLRSRLNLSQSAFAALLNINVRTLQGWEQGVKQPKGPAIALLSIADKNPGAFMHHPQ